MPFFLIKKKLESFDWTLFILIFLLLILGVAIQYSLSLGLEPGSLSIFKKQVAFILLGLLIFFIVSFLDFRILKSLGLVFYIVSLLLLLFLLIFGETFHGVKGWYFLGFIYFQPVELVKIVLIIIFAKIWAGKVKEAKEIKRIVLSFIFLVPPVILTLIQPDFGAALIFILSWFFFTAINTQKTKYLLFILVLLVLASLFLWGFVLKDYQKSRIISFFSPAEDPLGRGYQIAQSKIAIGAGRIFGRGIGYGSQGQMRFLPASRNDFIFAALSEELGFIGSIALVILYALIFLKMIKISRTIYEHFGFFLVLGIAFNLFIQVIINTGMNLGLLPVVGISLPLISYGGSSMVTTLFSLGIVESVIIRQRVTSA